MSTSEQKSLNVPAQQEIDRLAANLFSPRGGASPQSVLMMDLGSGASSLWVATGVASALSKSFHKAVYVLSVAGNTAASKQDSASTPAGCVLERLSSAPWTTEGAAMLQERVAVLTAEGNTVLIHLPYFEESGHSFPRVNYLGGVVLLVRASRTYRAAIEAIEKKLAVDGAPLLGTVLLDRVYPIPEKLYRVL